MSFFIPLAAGALTGVLSAFGVGGGTLLMIYMTLAAGLPQTEAQGINLLYFIPTSLAALYWHIKNGLIVKNVTIPAVIAGTLTAVAASFAATSIDTELLHKVFGGFLILTGLWELFRKTPEEEK